MIVTLPPELTIAHAAEWKAPLLAAMRSGGEVLLDGLAVTRVDVLGLQLLLAAKKSALAADVPFGFLPGGRSAEIDRAAAAAGLITGRDAPEETLWREAHHV